MASADLWGFILYWAGVVVSFVAVGVVEAEGWSSSSSISLTELEVSATTFSRWISFCSMSATWVRSALTTMSASFISILYSPISLEERASVLRWKAVILDISGPSYLKRWCQNYLTAGLWVLSIIPSCFYQTLLVRMPSDVLNYYSHTGYCSTLGFLLLAWPSIKLPFEYSSRGSCLESNTGWCRRFVGCGLFFRERQLESITQLIREVMSLEVSRGTGFSLFVAAVPVPDIHHLHSRAGCCHSPVIIEKSPNIITVAEDYSTPEMSNAIIID